ncbi:glycerol kinase GlpK [Methylobacterium sp. WL19]|uniref:glycerol kinase GlpK n=1 Tax=Methylobacterium sp. WL19 TaxID=2603896 RepID=UPI0011CA5413|nr:glycerol kinase GlpK [Methylobacterium sp. WL19]TXN25863.1 glycerol kinase GlpK [Methylobacterium sp. WL19]
MSRYVGAIDQGTTSTRFIVFDRVGAIITVAQREHEQIYPRPGHVEHDANEIWRNTRTVMREALETAGLQPSDLVSIGITNQRETTLIWDRASGRPLHNALVWQDTRVDGLVAEFARDGGKDRFRALTGLPLASYFSGLKLVWLLDRVPGARAAAEAGDVLFGTIDTWLVWNLTGGPQGGLHITDATNASRTQLMALDTLDWDAGMISAFGIPRAMLPRIVSSSMVYGETRGALPGVHIAGILGDQQAALFGQACFSPGKAKNTYGTGCFVLMNTGTAPVPSTCGLVTTLAYRLGDEAPVYALEGSIAITGALVQWLRDNLGLIRDSAEIEPLARTVEDNGDVYFVPAFSGLYAPHWRESARGIIAGLTRYANKGHIARAALEATAYQTREVIEAMETDSGIAITELRADGGMVCNDLLMQFQADLLAVPVLRPKVTETTALGAAYAAGLASGYWAGTGDLVANWGVDHRWHPRMDEGRRNRLYAAWGKAVTRSFGWTEPTG